MDEAGSEAGDGNHPLFPALSYLEFTMADHFLTLGVFMLGAGAGGLCILLQQMGIRSRMKKEITNQLDKALFGPIRQQRHSTPKT
jgi:hypothetical protein